MDPLKRSLVKNTKSTETADSTTYQVFDGLTNKRSVVITGAGAYDFSRKLLLVESFGILSHATRTCRETSTPAPSQRPRFVMSVTQRSRRSSSAWYAFSRSTEPFPSGRSWTGTDSTTRDNSKLFEVVCKKKTTWYCFSCFSCTSLYHAHVLSASLRRPDVSRSFTLRPLSRAVLRVCMLKFYSFHKPPDTTLFSS